MSWSWISELIKQHGTLPTPDSLFEDGGTRAAGSGEQAARDGEGTAPGQRAGAVGGGEQDTGNAGRAGTGVDAGAGQETRGTAGRDGEGAGAGWQVARRIESGTVACRYAGAMLVHAFTSRIDAQGLLRSGTGAAKPGPAPSGPGWGRTTWAS